MIVMPCEPALGPARTSVVVDIHGRIGGHAVRLRGWSKDGWTVVVGRVPDTFVIVAPEGQPLVLDVLGTEVQGLLIWPGGSVIIVVP